MANRTAHLDTFARDNLPPDNEWPTLLWGRPELQYPAYINCATELLDVNVALGRGPRTAVISPNEQLTYAGLTDRANRIAAVLRYDMGLVPGNRVLIRSANNPQFLAAWLGIAKAGGIVVATMPLLRAGEIATIVDKAEVTLALCDERLAQEMEKAGELARSLARICYFNGSGEADTGAELESRMHAKDGAPVNVLTAADDTVLIAFTSGTTGVPKGTMHFHRDVLAMSDCFPRSTLRATEDDVFIGSPPLAFTFGLGGLATFPLRAGASTVLLETASPDTLAPAIERYGATVCFTAPTAFRAIAGATTAYDLTSLSKCISAGETLPLPTYEQWLALTGISIMDGMGSTEMLHIFISSSPQDTRPGATGKPIPGYEACVVDEDMRALAPDEVGKLAVRGPTGCRYLSDDRQREYVRDGWNLTGDAFRMDEDGYFWFEARADDMIISAGYNIAGPEVEAAVMAHPAVRDCAVVAAPDDMRGFIAKAYVVPNETADAPDGQSAGRQFADTHSADTLAREIQAFVKARIAPYKYPRAIEFVKTLPRTETGKVQRFKLRERAKS
jgi:2-aminobenzoate-CoA ligase